MILEGIVTNVANFGAFVDVGVHQDGLVHISELSHEFVKDPRNVVKTGQIVKVKVLEVDKNRKRISLSMCLEKSNVKAPHKIPEHQHHKKQPAKSAHKTPHGSKDQQPGSMALAFAAALKGQKS
jgi:uncharacterized protein